MLFSLANLKKRSVRDPDGELAVVPKLLHGRTAIRELEQAIDLFDAQVGKPRSDYNAGALEAVMGDYRLGRCIEACLLTRYAFMQPTFEDVLTPEQTAALHAHSISSPSAVRLAVWDAANAMHGGFAPVGQRGALLASVAEGWGINPEAELIDRLIELDSESAAVLTRSGEPPTPRDLMLQYNRGAVKTLLAHATQVEISMNRLPGAALKRLYFIAKRRGVLVDIEQAGAGFSLTLYGPEQAFGSADKYGRRLADVSLDLARQLLTLADAEIEATAHLILHERHYRFHVTPDILSKLGYAPEAAAGGKNRVAETTASYSVGSAVAPGEQGVEEEPSFDSLVEMRLYKEYMSLQRGGYTHGWTLQREPEPLLAPGVVMIPDFGFQRGDTRVFMEIAGFWSPGYRERKVAKLKALAAHEGYQPMILAVPQDAAATFAGLPFPVVTYKNKVAATDLLTLLDRDYGSKETRQQAAMDKLAELREEAAERGLIPETEVAARLEAYTRTELLALAQDLSSDAGTYAPGVGLLAHRGIDAMKQALSRAIDSAQDHRLDLTQAERVLAAALSVDHVDVESLLPLLDGYRLERPSLFEAYLVGR